MATKADIAELRERFDRFEFRIDERFDRMEERMDRMQRQFLTVSFGTLTVMTAIFSFITR
ncbi:MAG: hypothetical protein WA726_11940 [Acidimicrobiia bacterium]